jgi:hypothetical protein
MSTNRYIDKLRARLANRADQRMQLQALLDDQVARNRALLAERDVMRAMLDEVVTQLEGNADGLIEGSNDHEMCRVIKVILQGEIPQ